MYVKTVVIFVRVATPVSSDFVINVPGVVMGGVL
jgi:hypothetical protein